MRLQDSAFLSDEPPEFGRNAVKKKQHKNYQDEDKKSAINKKLILRVLALVYPQLVGISEFMPFPRLLNQKQSL